MAVTVLRRRAHEGVSTVAVRRDARDVLDALGESQACLTVNLVDDEEIHRLNREYRGKDRPTDVLAFAVREGPRVPGDDTELGDVVISVETAVRQARRRGVDAAAEVRTLLVHGVLHLLGYDHERSLSEARRMFAMQRRLLLRLRARQALPMAPRPLTPSPSRKPR